LNILIVNWFKPNEVQGGCENVFSDLSKILDAKFVSISDASKTLGISFPPQYYRYANIDRSILLSKYINEYEKLYDIDIIISNDDCAAFIESKAPIIIVCGNPYKWIANELYKRKIYNTDQYYEFGYLYPLMQQISMKKAKNIAVSAYMKGYITELGCECHKVIEHGIDTELFKPMNKEELREKYGIPKDATVAVSIQKFHGIKWHLMPELIKEFKDIFWIIVFAHPINKKIRAKNVKIFNPIPRNILPEIYNCADICIQPSILESFNLCALEAMSCNIPVVTGKTGWFWDAEAEGSYGRAVKEWSVDAYIKAIKEVLEIKDNPDQIKPRQVIIDNEATFSRWSEDWKRLIKDVV
jgi:glycosyltransferase involved in cell wall biosynthesis